MSSVVSPQLQPEGAAAAVVVNMEQEQEQEQGVEMTAAGAGGGAGTAAETKQEQEDMIMEPIVIPRRVRTASMAAVPGVLLEWNNIVLKGVVTGTVEAMARDPSVKLIRESQFKKKCKARCGPLPCARAIRPAVYEKRILNGISGYVRPGELIAVMGASGAGKSSLLNVLAGRNSTYEGSVLINNKDAQVFPKTLSAYVQQEDILMGNLTVREHLRFQARLRMDKNMSIEAKYKYVDRLINSLNLEKCRDQQIGAVTQNMHRGISGGERKRVAFASEIITNPTLLFADEPTSGLDSFMAEKIIRSLKDLTANGRSVVATIHQPSSEVYALFDRLCLLSEGRVVYFGNTKDAIPYFTRIGYPCPPNYNPADYFIDILAIAPLDEPDEAARDAYVKGEQNRIAAIADAWEKHGSGNQLDPAERTQLLKSNATAAKQEWETAGVMEQISVLTKRGFIAELRDAVLTRARLGQAIILGLLLGLMYLRLDNDRQVIQNKTGVIFFILINQAMMGAFGVLQTFPLERPIFQREHENGNYSVGAYYMSKVISALPSQIFFPVFFVAIAYWIVGVRDELHSFLAFTLVIVLVTNAAMSLGYAISSAVPTVQVALAVGPLCLLPFILFGGFFLNVDSIPVYFIWLEKISFFKYGFSTLAIIIFRDSSGIGGCLPGPRSVCKGGDEVLADLGFYVEDYYRDILALCLIVVGFRVLAFIALWLGGRKKQNE